MRPLKTSVAAEWQYLTKPLAGVWLRGSSAVGYWLVRLQPRNWRTADLIICRKFQAHVVAHLTVLYCIVLYLFIYIALLIARAFHKRSRLQHCYYVGVNTPKRYRQLRVRDFPKVSTWRLQWESHCGIRTCDHPDGRHRTYHWATMPHSGV